MNKIIKRIGSAGLVPVVVIENANDAVPVARALFSGGIDIIEVTMRTDAAIAAMKAVSEAVPEMLVGAGTVLSIAMIKMAMDAGSKFIVTPGLNPIVAKYCIDIGVPITPGCVTPTEIEQALALNINILKFFPAGLYGGINGCKNLSGPYRMIKFLPTGGININNLSEYVDKPYIHAVGGSWLCSTSDIDKGNYNEITKLSKESVNILVGFDLNNPQENEYTHNLERAKYHLELLGYIDMGNDIMTNDSLNKKIKLNLKSF